MIPFDTHSNIETIKEWKGRKGFFAKVFLINDKRNKNMWRATWESIQRLASSFVGFPGIEFTACADGKCELDHITGQTYENTLVEQASYRVSTVVDTGLVENEPNTAYAVHDCLPAFYAKLERKEIQFVSPAIWPKGMGATLVGTAPDGRPMLDTFDWLPVHVAFVNNPAYGDDAVIYSQCSGSGEACGIQMNASAKPPVLIEHHGKLTYFTPPDEIREEVLSAIKNDQSIIKLLKSKIEEPKPMECMKMAETQVMLLQARVKLMQYEAEVRKASEEKPTDKPDVDERGAKCHWVTARGRKFQVCEDTKQKPTEKSPESERREEKK